MKNQRPKIIGFLCNWCAYAGADLAGVSRLQYPPEFRAIRVMCSGRVEPIWILRAFKVKMDGVLVLGCHPGDCHYKTGNYQAERKGRFLKKVLKRCGIDEERFCIDWVSASEGRRFTEVVSNFTELLRNMPPIAQTPNLEEKIDFALSICETVRLRWLVGKEWELTTQGNVYNELVEEERLNEIIDKNIDEAYLMGKILRILSNGPMSPIEIAKELDILPRKAFFLLIKMENKGLIQLHDEVNHYPRFAKVV